MYFLSFCRQSSMRAGFTVASISLLLIQGAPAQERKLTLKQTSGTLVIEAGSKPLATYVLADNEIARPFYAHVYAPTGEPVTRSFPPQAGADPTDHATMHPGLWLAFGDLSGHDFWRNKGRVKHASFAAEPKAEGKRLSFSVRNEYVAADGANEKKIATETCTHRWLLKDHGALLTIDSELTSADPAQPLVFGDQEEMGLGVRVATPLRVQDARGEIMTSDGKRNEKEAWGKQAQWCDYRGNIDGRQVGITLMPHPDNFRPSWFHVRDYGLMVANPFGQNALTRGEKSRVEVKPGDKLRLRFGVWIHSGKEAGREEAAKAYEEYIQNAAKSK